MVTKLAITLILSLVVSLNSYAHDSDRIGQLEKEIQETKQRLSILESMLHKKNHKQEFVITGDGWKSITNWRQLTTGMSTSTVQKLLGDAHRVEGGTFAKWYYDNGGVVNFYEGEVDRWSEPR